LRILHSVLPAVILRPNSWFCGIETRSGSRKNVLVAKRFSEDEKSLAGDLANYNWKIFACYVVFDNVSFAKADAIGHFLLHAPMASLCRLLPRCLISFRFEESKA